MIATDESGNTSKKQITVTVTETNGTENPETVTETSENLPNNNNTTPPNKNHVNSSTGNKKTSGNSNSSNSKPSNNKPSNGGGSSNSKPSKPSSGGSSGESTTTKPTHCTTNSNHSIKCGSINKWFSSKSELQNYVSSVIADWRNKRANGEITLEEYNKYAPTGYRAWSCAYCGKWTGDFKYR